MHEIWLLIGEVVIKGTKLALNTRLGTKSKLLIEQYYIAIREFLLGEHHCAFIASQTQAGTENIRSELKSLLNNLLAQKDYVDKTSNISAEGIIRIPRQVKCRGRPAQERKKGHEEITICKTKDAKKYALFFC